MADKRNPTEHTEERTSRGSSDGPSRLPDDAEHAEYTGYQKEDGEAGRKGDAAARREAGLQPGGAGGDHPERDVEGDTGERDRTDVD